MSQIIKTVGKLVAIKEADFTKERKHELALIIKFKKMFLSLSQEMIDKGIATKTYETMVNPRESTGISLSVTLAGTSDNTQNVLEETKAVLLKHDYIVRQDDYHLSGRTYACRFYHESLGVTILVILNGYDHRLTLMLFIGDVR